MKEIKVPFTTGGKMSSKPCLRLSVLFQSLCVATLGTVSDRLAHADASLASQRSDSRNPQSESTLEEVIVTAQKRSEKEQDVPMSLHVLSADALQDQGLVDLTDYAKVTPGLAILGAGAGTSQPGLGFLAIRGIATGADSTALVGQYLDDVPFTVSSSVPGNTQMILDPDIGDIDHIEVLGGPQGTLYGASSMGGVIKYVTKQPDLTSAFGSVRTEGSHVNDGGTGYGVRATGNVPLITDSIGLRASFFYREDPGFVDNTATNEKNWNFARVWGGNASILFKVSDNLQTVVSGLTQRTYSPSGLSGSSSILDPSTLGLVSRSLYAPLRNDARVTYQSIADTTTWQTELATLTNVLSYAHVEQPDYIDFSVFTRFLPGAPAGSGALLLNQTTSNRTTEELRLASVPGRFEWLVGGFATREIDVNLESNHLTSGTGQIVAPSDPNYNVYSYRGDFRYTELAAFGNLTYHLTDQIGATVGMRYSHSSQPWGDIQSGVLAGGTTSEASGSFSGSANTFLGTVTYKPNENTSVYLRAASGYRPGASIALNPIEVAAGLPDKYDSDHIWDYEAGVKGNLWGQRLNYSVDAFRMIWTDCQLTASYKGFGILSNVGSARSDGVEASVEAVPAEGLTVAAKGAYIDARVTADVPLINATDGAALPYSPKTSAAVLADYQIPTASEVKASFGLTYAYHSSVKTGFVVAGGALGPGTGVYSLPGYATLDLRAGISWNRYRLTGTVVNVTNRFAVVSGAGYRIEPSSMEFQGNVLQPRTLRLALEARF